MDFSKYDTEFKKDIAMDQYWKRMTKRIGTTLESCSRKCLVVLSALFFYFAVMDIILYVSLQRSDSLAFDKSSQHYSPFYPLTVKQLATDPFVHYILQPPAEWLHDWTNFSAKLPFLTPNVISVTHALLAFIVFKLLLSEHLHIRRYAVILFEFRIWLDVLDGVVYRATRGTKYQYVHNRAEMGYYVDAVCDIIATICLCVSNIFYLLKFPPSNTVTEVLPSTKPGETSIRQETRATRRILIATLGFGGLIILSSGMWDRAMVNLSSILQVHQSDPAQAALQATAFHSFMTWWILLAWSFVGPYALIHLLLLAIFLDKLWEFLSVVLYVGYSCVIVLVIITELHYNTLYKVLGVEPTPAGS